jgi:hypothetical protein
MDGAKFWLSIRWGYPLVVLDGNMIVGDTYSFRRSDTDTYPPFLLGRLLTTTLV